MSSSPATSRTSRPTRRLWLRALAAAAAASVVNVVLWLLARAVGIDFPMPDPASADGPTIDLAALTVVVASTLATTAAAVGRWVHVRFTRWPERVFPVGVGVLLALSFIQPFAVATALSVVGQLVLCTMHVVVALAVLAALGRRERL